MRLLVTADLHFNHGRSRPLAESVIADMNSAGGDAVLVVGDTGVADGDGIEQCLSLFSIRGPKLFVAGNHELWTCGDGAGLFDVVLPDRVRNLGWHWLEDDPVTLGTTTIVGSIGWYDYSFAVPELQIPRRFYEAKVSPGVAERLSEYAHLIDGAEPPESAEIIARWNDGKFVKLGMSDDAFLTQRLESLARQLNAQDRDASVVVAIHHVPFAELLPPRRGMQWDFARAFLGSGRIGELLQRYANVRHVFCGHSHWPAEAQIGQIRAVNVGCGYRFKTFKVVDLPD